MPRASPPVLCTEEGTEPSHQPTTGAGVPPGIGLGGEVALYVLTRLLLSRRLAVRVTALVAHAKRRSFFCPSPSNWVGSSAGPTPGPGLNSAAAPKGRSTLTSILPRASHTRGHRLASRRTWRGARTQRRSGCCVLRRLRRAFSTTSHTTLLWLRSPACRRSPVPMRSTRRAHSLGAEGLAAGSASGSSPIGCPSHRHVSSSPLAPRCRTAPFDGWRAGRRAIHATGLHSRRSAHSVAALPTPPPGFRTLLACRHQCPRCVALTGARVSGAFATGRNNCCFLSSARGSHNGKPREESNLQASADC